MLNLKKENIPVSLRENRENIDKHIELKITDLNNK